MTVPGSSEVGSYGQCLTGLGSPKEEGPAWGEPWGSALAAPGCSPIGRAVTGASALQCGQKETSSSKMSAQSCMLNLHSQCRGARQECPSCLCEMEGNGVLQRGQLERYQRVKVLGPRDESMADCAEDD